MDKTEQLIREIIKETLLAERRRGRKSSGRSFKPQNITDLLATRIKDPLDAIPDSKAPIDDPVPF